MIVGRSMRVVRIGEDAEPVPVTYEGLPEPAPWEWPSGITLTVSSPAGAVSPELWSILTGGGWPRRQWWLSRPQRSRHGAAYARRVRRRRSR